MTYIWKKIFIVTEIIQIFFQFYILSPLFEFQFKYMMTNTQTFYIKGSLQRQGDSVVISKITYIITVKNLISSKQLLLKI